MLIPLSMNSTGQMQSGAWVAYRVAQRARRHVRRRERMEQLWSRLPPRGVEVTKLGETGLSLRGFGVEIVWDPTHNVARVTGQPANLTMSPERVATEFRWRWKREGCP